MKSYNLAVFVSGSGTNLQTIVDAIDSGKIEDIKISLVISSNPSAFALERCKAEGLNSEVLRLEDFKDEEKYASEMLRLLKHFQIDMIFLAGYLKKLPLKIVKTYEGRIANVHPSLIPLHSGKGMYGLAPHEEVLKMGEKETGVTVHLVNENYDDGPIIMQKKIPVMPNDDAATLQRRVMQEGERIIVPQALNKLKEMIKGMSNVY